MITSRVKYIDGNHWKCPFCDEWNEIFALAVAKDGHKCKCGARMIMLVEKKGEIDG